MRQATIRKQVSRTLSVPSPTGGWNTRDTLADMKPNEAVILDNMFCLPNSVRVRPGSVDHVTGITGTVRTLMAYQPPSGSPKLFAAAGVNLYDASTTGVAGAPSLSHLTSDLFRKVTFGTGGGNYLVAVNGSDLPLVFDGTNWGNIFSAAFSTTIAASGLTSVGTLCSVTMSSPHNLQTGMAVTISGATQTAYNGTFVITRTGASTFTYTALSVPSATPATGSPIATPAVNFAITGVNPASLTFVNLHKNRLFFIQDGSMKAWYLPVNSVGGAAASLDFSSLFSRGGYLMAMGTWTVDGGYGLDDYAVFFTSEGQVAVYRGTDPASSSTWSLVGIYLTAQPVSRLCLQKYGGDLLVLTREGLAPLTKALISSAVTDRMMLTDNIQTTISDYTTLYAANNGWQQVLFQEENALIINVPVSSTVSYQLVMNTISGSWSRFLNWNASCWERFNNLVYFGTSGKVVQAWTGNTDSGVPISFQGLQSFSYANAPSQLKQVKMLRPTLTSEGQPNVRLGVNADFDTTPPTGLPGYVQTAAGVWDSAVWDESVWGGEATIRRDWQTAFCLGYCFAAHMVGTISASPLTWISTDYVLEGGGVV